MATLIFDVKISPELVCPSCSSLVLTGRVRPHITTFFYGKVLGLDGLRRLYGTEINCGNCGNNLLGYIPSHTPENIDDILSSSRRNEDSDGHQSFNLPPNAVRWVRSDAHRCGWFTNVSHCDIPREAQERFSFSCVVTSAPIQWYNPNSYTYRYRRQYPSDAGFLFGWADNSCSPVELNETYIPVTHKGSKKIPSCEFCRGNTLLNPGLSLTEFYAPDSKQKFFTCTRCAERHLDRHFFGFKFKKMAGRSTRLNPFDRYVGLELETVDGENFNYTQVPKNIRGLFKSVYDGSLHASNVTGEEDDPESEVNTSQYEQDNDHDNRGAGREFVTIPMAKDHLFTAIDNITAFLNNRGCAVNKSCGFHVHFDMSKENIETVRKTFLVFSIFEDTLFGMLPPTRKKSRYCLPLRKEYKQFFADDFESYWYNDGDWGKDQRRRNHSRWLSSVKHDKYNQTRYTSINYHALFYHGTLENRIHSGTLNPVKIKNWILLNQILIDFAVQTPMKRLLSLKGSKETFLNIIQSYQLRYPQLRQYNLCEYVIGRTNRFNPETMVVPPLVVKQELQPNIVERQIVADAMLNLYDKTPKTI